MGRLALFFCALSIWLPGGGVALAADVKAAAALLEDLNKRAKQITYNDEDEMDGPYTASETRRFALGEDGVLKFSESYSEKDSETGDTFSESVTYAIPLGKVHVEHEVDAQPRSVRDDKPLAAAVLTCNEKGCMRRTKDADKTWNKETSYELFCEPSACAAIEADFKQLVALARGEPASGAGGQPDSLPGTAPELVTRLNALVPKLALQSAVRQASDTAHIGTTLAYAGELVPGQGLLKLSATGKIQGKYEKSEKTVDETINESASIPLYAVTVKPNPQVVGTSVPGGAEVHPIVLACELQKGCIHVDTTGTDGKTRTDTRDSYLLLCEATTCDAVEPVLQKLVATVRIEWAKKTPQ